MDKFNDLCPNGYPEGWVDDRLKGKPELRIAPEPDEIHTLTPNEVPIRACHSHRGKPGTQNPVTPSKGKK